MAPSQHTALARERHLQSKYTLVSPEDSFILRSHGEPRHLTPEPASSLHVPHVRLQLLIRHTDAWVCRVQSAAGQKEPLTR